MTPKNNTVTPQKAIEILKRNGTIVTIEEAELVLAFMKKIAKLSIDQYMKI
ncbi:hypothetical protein SAMN05192574_101813 [Mucilaginibacter gossypiicola]|uniref:Uncharacterized protein n=1 Tax=Mucilaginibacter gossypiicola TaxID=551995 RepID=A0A1H8B7T7_9SPHI|nr:hypothetical protein SAMN05192574_101813 [Mucilaginibacter gossypiicola]